MTTSANDECARHHTAPGGRRKLVWIAGAVLLAALLALAIAGYRQPELLLDYVNLRYCG